MSYLYHPHKWVILDRQHPGGIDKSHTGWGSGKCAENPLFSLGSWQSSGIELRRWSFRDSRLRYWITLDLEHFILIIYSKNHNNLGKVIKMKFIYIYIYIYIYIPCLLYPFTCQWIFRLLPCPGCCKQCFSEHWGACILLDHVFLQICAQEWDCRVIW